jgi:hypothetical protein
LFIRTISPTPHLRGEVQVTKTVTFKSHHQINVIEAALQLLEVRTEADLERASKFDDYENVELCEIRLGRIAEARRNLYGRVTEAA